MVVAYIAAIIAGLCCLLIFIFVPSPRIRLIRLDQVFAFLSIIFLYFALLISPLYHSFRALPHKEKVVEARRTIGVASFVFALLHTIFAFFGQLNGFSGLPFLDNEYLFALIMGFIGLEILMVLAFTSFDKAISYLTFPKWKILHRFVYLGGILILIHMLLLGSHYQHISSLIPIITFIALAFLFILEAIRFDNYLEKKKKIAPRIGLTLITIVAGITYYAYSIFVPANNLSLGIHAQHLLLAQQNQNSQLPTSTQAIPGLNGDPNLRYTTSFNHNPTINVGEETPLNFTIYNASTGEEIKLFSQVYEKVMHLIIVDESLTYFKHLHPIQGEDNFTVITTFPKEGRYHLYVDFQPLGAREQQMAFSVEIGNPNEVQKNNTLPDRNLTKTINDYKVSLNYASPLIAKKMSLGQQQLEFTIQDAKTQKPITTLKPYLAAFGHLTMINESSFDFIHVHPFLLTPPTPNSNGGPNVKFVPLGVWGPIKPGVYRVFAEFNPNNSLITADFTVKIE